MRWPPILGVIGFDGGSKPAIALARDVETQRRRDIRRGRGTPPDIGPVVDLCPPYDELTVTISGWDGPCGFVADHCVEIAADTWREVEIDINGAWTPDGSGYINMGEGTQKDFASETGCSDPDEMTSEETLYIDGFATCTGLLVVARQTAHSSGFSDPFLYKLFEGSGPLGTTINNTVECLDASILPGTATIEGP